MFRSTNEYIRVFRQLMCEAMAVYENFPTLGDGWVGDKFIERVQLHFHKICVGVFVGYISDIV